MKNFIKVLLQSNLMLKLVALALAIITWVYVKGLGN